MTIAILKACCLLWEKLGLIESKSKYVWPVVYPVKPWKRVSSKTFNFMKMKSFLKMENTWKNLLGFCKILWRNIQTRGLQQYINSNEIFDGQEQQSNSDICLNQEIPYTFISSWNCDCSLWLKVKSFHENLWKLNLSKQKHHMLLLFPWFLEHFTTP